MATIVTEISRKASYDQKQTTVTRVLRVRPYAARLDVIGSLLGGVRQVGSTLYRTPPARDPWLPWCFVDSVSEDGEGQFLSPLPTSGNHLPLLNYYDNAAILTANYKTLEYDPTTAQGANVTPQQEIDLASESYDFQATALTLPNKRFGWSDTVSAASDVDGLLVRSDIAATKTMARMQYSLTRHYVVSLPITAITQQLGRINKNPFIIGLNTYPRETLRFESLSAQRKVTNYGIRFYELVHKFAVCPIYDTVAESYDTTKDANNQTYVGWNRLFDPVTNKWRYVSCAADVTRRIYDLDEDAPGQTLRGVAWKGFYLLFHPLAR